MRQARHQGQVCPVAVGACSGAERKPGPVGRGGYPCQRYCAGTEWQFSSSNCLQKGPPQLFRLSIQYYIAAGGAAMRSNRILRIALTGFLASEPDSACGSGFDLAHQQMRSVMTTPTVQSRSKLVLIAVCW